jgi:hypothetical protein
MRLGGVCPTVIIPGIHVRLEFARTLNQKWASPYPLSARVRTDSLRAAILSREVVKRPLRVIRKRLREGFLLYDQILYMPVLERAVGEEAADHEGDLSVAELLHCDGERVRLALEVDEDGRVHTNGNPRELENWMRRCFAQCREKN